MPLNLTVHVVQRFLSNYFFSLFICVFFSWGTPPSTLSNSPTEDKLNKAGVDRSSTVIAKEPEGKSELIFQLISELLSLNVFNNILFLWSSNKFTLLYIYIIIMFIVANSYMWCEEWNRKTSDSKGHWQYNNLKDQATFRLYVEHIYAFLLWKYISYTKVSY